MVARLYKGSGAVLKPTAALLGRGVLTPTAAPLGRAVLYPKAVESFDVRAL